MARTITVKGTGRIRAEPDWVVITLSRESHKLDYDKAVETASDRMQKVVESLVAAGFAREDLKTTSYSIHADYVNVTNRVRGQERQFNGYVVEHQMKLSFPLSRERLSSALRALSGCLSHPEFEITFLVKDPSPLKEELMRRAAADARRTAEVLCAASGVQLGELASIQYSWDSMEFCSPTRCTLSEESMVPRAMAASLELEPEEIETSDTATFVWEIR